MKTKIALPTFFLSIFAALQSTFSYGQCIMSNLGQNVGNYVVGYTRCGQTFTANCTGEITAITIRWNAIPSSSGDRILNIRDGNATNSPIIYTQTIPFNSIVVGENVITLNTPVPINMGEQNGFEITQSSPVSTSAHGVAHNDPGAYAGGSAWFGNTLQPNYDLTFSVQISLPCVPNSITPNIATLSDINVSCSVTSITAPTASNNCGDAIIGTTATTFPITTQGTHTVVWVYNDGQGNITSQNQTVIIDDVTPPIALVGSLSTITSECGVASISAPSAIDNCAGTLTATPNVSFPINTQGTTTITWTFDDGNGNLTTQTQQVVIDDVTDPIPNAILQDAPDCFQVTLSTPTANDNCAGLINGVPDVSMPISTPGLTVVTWTYDDGNGNVSTQTQNVYIEDTEDPVPSGTLSNVTSCFEANLATPTANDNCAGLINGVPNVSLPITTPGLTVVTWSYDDGNGNVTTQTQNVTVSSFSTSVVINGSELSANESGLSYQWIDCNNGNTSIAGATEQSFTPSVDGNYAVVLSNGSCTDTSNCVIVSGLSIDENKLDQVSIFPNPVTDYLQIQTDLTTVSVQIFSIDGKLIGVYDDSTRINTEGLKPGNYFISIQFADSISNIHFIKV